MKYLYVLLFVLYPLFSIAHGDNNHELELQVVDNVTNRGLASFTKVSLLDVDSVFLSSASDRWKPTRKIGQTSHYYTLPVHSSGRYILKCENEDYHTLYMPIEVKLHKRERVISLGKIGLRRKLKNDMTVELEGVEVLGTRIKFYYDNDTLVYNAAPFITQKGFVLSEMLKKMPGIEVRDDGNIYSNGKQVNALLLNGKDFFQKDRKTLLENLPAFMVKNVKVYNKTKDSLSVFQREREFEGLVMDVKLKKDYNHSQLANLDGGIGTADGYYGKLFGMDFSDLHRLSVFAGTNNVNKNEDLEEGEYASNSDYGVGRNKYSKAGLNYNVDHSQGKYSLSGDVTIDYIDQNAEQMNSTRLFSKDGDMFSRSFNHERIYSLKMKTSHDLNLWENSPYSLTLRPSISYHHLNQKLYSAQGTYYTDLGSLYGDKWLDSLTAIVIGTQMMQYGINRQIEQNKLELERTEAKLDVSKAIEIPHTSDRLVLKAEALHSNSKTKNFRQSNLDYLGTMPAENDWSYHYLNPNNKLWKMGGTAEYRMEFTEKSKLTTSVTYSHQEDEMNNPVFKLHEMDGVTPESVMFGYLPSAEILCNVSDKANSYSHTLTDNHIQAILRYDYIIRKNEESGKREISFFAEVPFKLSSSRIHFVQNQTDETVSNRMTRPDVELGFLYNKHGMTEKKFSVNYKQEHEMASPLQMIDIYDDTNPLMMRHGNKDLKDVLRHSLTITAFLNNMMKGHCLLVASYAEEKNAITSAILFDRTTGAWNVTPMNTNGNRTFTIVNRCEYSLPHQWTLQNTGSFLWANLVNYSGMSLNEYGEKSWNHMQRLSESVTVGKMSANMKHRVSLSPFVTYNHTGNRRNLQKNMENWEYGVKGSISLELPWDLKYETDLNAVRRSGFAFNDLNKSEYVWNMNLRKSFGEKIALRLEVNDLLNQKHYVTNVVTPQMEMENQFNHLGRYAMFHVVYKFTKGKQQ
ncbi:hypothetical protein L6472_00400 [Prevotella sp. E13-17]|uniref:hypothetical protein n=1 Tax=Prevotella sp. E13-17 TaxID=2913616 RepID=UPI001EDB7E56|nr:hypothetical protein [Prevotella sp. E13-17]UKK51091.1 hypothetical protein L6472_00400 [Prevotella sp. E13-17]